MADFVKPSPVTELFSSSIQLVIPRFQRRYEWSCAKEDDEIPTLWDDIVQACENDTDHYIGAVVIMPYNMGTGLHKHYLIDGQQRCTTLSILFRALYEHMAVANGINYPGLCRKYVIEEDYNAHKLVRSVEGDDYARLIDSISFETHYAPRKTCAERCYQYFSSKLKEIEDNPTDKINIINIFETVRNRIKVVLITVSDEDPCVIFESLNNTGRKLTPISMVRNYVMLKCASLDLSNDQFQDDIYKNYWIPFEDLAAGDESKLGEYLRIHLMMSGKRISKSDMYPGVKARIDDATRSVNTIDGMKNALSSIISPWLRDYDDYLVTIGERRFEGSNDASQSINDSLAIIKECGFKSQRNYVLKLFTKYRAGCVEKDAVVKILRMIESFIVRRTLYRDMINNTVDIMFLRMCAHDIFEPYDVYRTLDEETGAGMWPTDDDLRFVLETKDFYSVDRRGLCSSILSRVDTFCGNKKEYVVSNKTNEHIFPQEPCSEWKVGCGEDYNYMREHVNRLGNITIMDSSYNSKNGNRPYDEKKEIYLQSLYCITNSLPTEYPIWDRVSMEDRQSKMMSYITDIWPRRYELFQ